jgi:hypothetical protein
MIITVYIVCQRYLTILVSRMSSKVLGPDGILDNYQIIKDQSVNGWNVPRMMTGWICEDAPLSTVYTFYQDAKAKCATARTSYIKNNLQPFALFIIFKA